MRTCDYRGGRTGDPCLAAPGGTVMRKPNILFIQVDQLGAAFLRPYGNGTCVSPNIDRLAEEGVVFENAYCNVPLCAPSRFSMATGQLASTVGAYDNAAEMPASIPTYAHYLRAMGYRTALSGKMHFIGPDQYHGFEKRLTPDLYPADFSWVPNWGDEGKRDTNDPRSVQVSGVAARSIQIDFDEEVAHRAIGELYDFARSRDERPFFLQVSFTHPHEPYLCLRRDWDLYSDTDVPLPEVGPLPAERQDAHSLRLLKDFGFLGRAFPEADVQRARRAYFGSISYIDRLVGRILAALAETGADRRTAVVFTSDHGDMLGERGLWFKKHFFEPSLRVPLILNAPWMAPQRVRELASLVDLLPTLCGLASGSPWSDPVGPIAGIDLATLLDLGDPPPKRTVRAEYLAEAALAPILMIRRGRWKYVGSPADPPLLFDLEADPRELNNLAVDPLHAETVAAFAAESSATWDVTTLTAKILRSQRQRRLVLEAGRMGEPPRWNHGETDGQDVVWYRGVGSYNAWAFDHLPEVTADSAVQDQPNDTGRAGKPMPST